MPDVHLGAAPDARPGRLGAEPELAALVAGLRAEPARRARPRPAADGPAVVSLINGFHVAELAAVHAGAVLFDGSLQTGAIGSAWTVGAPFRARASKVLRDSLAARKAIYDDAWAARQRR